MGLSTNGGHGPPASLIGNEAWNAAGGRNHQSPPAGSTDTRRARSRSRASTALKDLYMGYRKPSRSLQQPDAPHTGIAHAHTIPFCLLIQTVIKANGRRRNSVGFQLEAHACCADMTDETDQSSRRATP